MLQFYLLLVENDEDESKIELIYNTYKNIMYNRAFDILKKKELAEDAVHNAFLRILKNIEKINPENFHKTRSFVVVIVENVAKTMYKREKRIINFENIELQADISYDDTLEKLELSEILAEKVEKLSDKHREVLMLKYIYELDNKEIAKSLNISESTVRKRIQYGKIYLRRLLEGDE